MAPGVCLWQCVLFGVAKTQTALDARVGLLFMSWITLDESVSLSEPGFPLHYSVTSSTGSDLTDVMRTR